MTVFLKPGQTHADIEVAAGIYLQLEAGKHRYANEKNNENENCTQNNAVIKGKHKRNSHLGGILSIIKCV